MNLGTVARPNAKGQIVIPKKFREELGIDENVLLNVFLKGNGVFITPLDKTLGSSDAREMVLEILKRTAGTWAGDDWEKTSKARRQIELKASQKRKNEW